MKLRIISDLHLEFYKHDDYMLDIMDDEENIILILAGDIAVAGSINRFKYFFEDISNRFKYVLYVMGNHEYYGSSVAMCPMKLKLGLTELKNIKLLENKILRIDDHMFIGCTLWTDFDNHDPICMYDAKLMMRDFKKIRIGPVDMPWKKPFNPNDAYMIHKISLNFMKESLENKQRDIKYVVINHHAPSELSISSEFKGNSLNGAYYSDLQNFIYEYQPDLMIHGHMHKSFDYMIDNTRIVCNPYGYNSYEENPDFNKKFTIEL